ncbi:MAG: aldehyde dehydrogenase family protein [Tissierellaceae bacterium]
MTKNIFWEFKNYINGQWVDSLTGEKMGNYCPGDGELVSKVSKSGKEDVDKAVSSAKEALEKSDWAYDPRLRSDALFEWARSIKENHEEVSTILSLESGKPISEARMEVSNAINYLKYNAGAIKTLYGRSNSIDRNTLSVMSREPVGVVGAILPWNYPVTLFMRDAIPALAAGNTLVFKPASQTSASNMVLIKYLHQTSMMPKGVINGITGQGKLIGDSLVNHPDIDMITFTGSSETGKNIMKQCADTMKKVSLELGGKSPNIVFADADIDKAIPYIIKAAFSNAGQLCTLGSRLILDSSIAEEFLDRLVKEVESLKVGHGIEEDTQLGPVISEKQMNKIMDYIEEGKENSWLLTGGFRLDTGQYSKGYFIAPTLLLNPPVNSKLVQEEIFGPVLAIQTFDTEDKAIELANCTDFGLASGIWTQDISKAMRVSRKIRAGTCWINCYNKLFPEAETGGLKKSGIGRAAGLEGILKYTEIKHICIDYAQQ